MIVEVFKCEICSSMQERAYIELKMQHARELHFCSHVCLGQWLVQRGVEPKQQDPQEQPACKARRFLLWDEHANSSEGVQWADGSVTLQSGLTWVSWSKFKANHEGSGVQWIDQEVAE